MSAIEVKMTREIEEESYTALSFDILSDGVPVGGATVMSDSGYTYCDRIDIGEAFRNRGIGTAALNLLSEKFGGLVVAPDNADAQRLYARLGNEWYGADAPYIDQGYGVYEV